MAPILLLLPDSPWSVVIPDEKADSERLQSIATIQKRLQALLDEGRSLRQSLEVMTDLHDASMDLERRRQDDRRR